MEADFSTTCWVEIAAIGGATDATKIDGLFDGLSESSRSIILFLRRLQEEVVEEEERVVGYNWYW